MKALIEQAGFEACLELEPAMPGIFEALTVAYAEHAADMAFAVARNEIDPRTVEPHLVSVRAFLRFVARERKAVRA